MNRMDVLTSTDRLTDTRRWNVLDANVEDHHDTTMYMYLDSSHSVAAVAYWLQIRPHCYGMTMLTMYPGSSHISIRTHDSTVPYSLCLHDESTKIIDFSREFDTPSSSNLTSAKDSLDFFASWKRLVEYGYRERLSSMNKAQEIIEVLRLTNLGAAASRIDYLNSLDDDDPDEAPIQVDSLRHLALFLIEERSLQEPRIGVSPDGLMQIEWRLEYDGILAMQFLGAGQIQFAAIAGNVSKDMTRERLNGTLQKADMMEAIHPFLLGIQSQ